MPFETLFQTADWKTEKHVPVIECPAEVKAGELFKITVSLGKAVAHPNTTEHHIRWIDLYFLPDGAKAAFQVSHSGFCAHGEATVGPNQGPVYTNHETTASLKIGQSGTIFATAMCNIHGLWQASQEIKAL